MWQLAATLAGGLAGGIGNYLTADEQARVQRDAIEKYNGDISRALAAYMSETGRNIDAYNLESRKYLNTPDGVAAWLNPNMEWQLEQVAKANNQQYAAGSKMLSGAAMKSLQDRSQNVAKLSWNDAFSQMTASNDQGLGNLRFGTQMSNDMASNVFNAQQGIYGNNLNAMMGMRTAGVGDFLTGFGNGANFVGNVANAFRSSPSAGQPAQVQTSGV